jgi:hypothetical protein
MSLIAVEHQVAVDFDPKASLQLECQKIRRGPVDRLGKSSRGLTHDCPHKAARARLDCFVMTSLLTVHLARSDHHQVGGYCTGYSRNRKRVEPSSCWTVVLDHRCSKDHLMNSRRVQASDRHCMNRKHNERGLQPSYPCLGHFRRTRHGAGDYLLVPFWLRQ